MSGEFRLQDISLLTQVALELQIGGVYILCKVFIINITNKGAAFLFLHTVPCSFVPLKMNVFS